MSIEKMKTSATEISQPQIESGPRDNTIVFSVVESGGERAINTEPSPKDDSKGSTTNESLRSSKNLNIDDPTSRAIPPPQPPDTPTSSRRKRQKTRRKLFGLNRGSPMGNQRFASNLNRFDYEQKYPRDRFGEELSDNARVWFTYLDEAESYDRDRVEGWRDTIDVLLVFTGLFSAVVSTFLVQSSQNLQQNSAQVSASSSNVPNPNTPSNPSTNALLVNGLWFASLTISLSTALFAVLTKQWLYHYMSTISGTAREQAKIRHFRFKGLEKWRVTVIIDLLPIFLHLALGLFLIGLVVFTIPLDIRIAWMITVLGGLTYSLYFLSVVIPIWHPQCAYTTPLTTYLIPVIFSISVVVAPFIIFLSSAFMGLFFIIRNITRKLFTYGRARGSLHAFGRSLHRLSHVIGPILLDSTKLVKKYLRVYLQKLKLLILGVDIQGFTNWRQEKLKRSIERTPWLDLQAVHWLHTITSNPSIQRIVARSVSMSYSKAGLDFSNIGSSLWCSGYEDVLGDRSLVLALDKPDLEDICHALYLSIPFDDTWYQYVTHIFFTAPPNALGHIRTHHPELHDFVTIISTGDYASVLLRAFRDGAPKIRPVVWHYLSSRAQENQALAAFILTSPKWPLFGLESENPTTLNIEGPSEKELGEWASRYLLRCLRLGSQIERFEYGSLDTSYLLSVAIYQDIISNQSFFMDQRLRQEILTELFRKFATAVPAIISSQGDSVTSEFLNTFQRDILFAEAFWEDRVTYLSRTYAIRIFEILWESYIERTGDVSHLYFIEDQQLQFAYRWCSTPGSSTSSKLMVLRLFMSKDLTILCNMLRADPDAKYHFRRSLRCLQHSDKRQQDRKKLRKERARANSNLIRLYRAVASSYDHGLFSVLYDPGCLAVLWTYFLTTSDLGSWEQDFTHILQSKFDPPRLTEIFGRMIDEAMEGKMLPWRHVSYRSAYKFARRALDYTDSQYLSHLPVGLPQSMNFASGEEMVSVFARELQVEELRSSFRLYQCYRFKDAVKRFRNSTASDAQVIDEVDIP